MFHDQFNQPPIFQTMHQPQAFQPNFLGTSQNQRLTQEAMQRYLDNPNDLTVSIFHTKVVQKSYGSEKRFFCPPPSAYFHGEGWRRRRNELLHLGETSKSSQLCASIGVDKSLDRTVHNLDVDQDKCYYIAKTLHVSHSDTRKHIELSLKLFYANGHDLGIFHSQRIRVISKPSKKKSQRNTHLSITNGSQIALFNRIKGQNVSTRYLFVEDGVFCANSSQWGAFAIYRVDDEDDEESGDENNFLASDGFVSYGDTVRLKCMVTGIMLPSLIIRPVDKQRANARADDSVSQLQKCALYLKGTNRSYLSVAGDKVICYEATPDTTDPGKDVVVDGVCWTIISTEMSEYKFFEGMGIVRNPITPVPVVNLVCTNGAKTGMMLELTGSNFTPILQVWFADVEADTFYRCMESIVCMVPDKSRYGGNWLWVRDVQGAEVPISLVRDDGVIYATGIVFRYDAEIEITRHATVDEIIRGTHYQGALQRNIANHGIVMSGFQ